MNVYDLMQKYGSKKSESHLWDAIYAVSKYVDIMKDYDEALAVDLYKEVYTSFNGKHFNSEFGLPQIEAMSYSKNGITMHAPYWPIEDMKYSYDTIKDLLPEQYTDWDFIVGMCYLNTQFAEPLSNWFGDKAYDRLVELTVSFLTDPEEEHKIWKLLE